jgi:signal transduction histidine kinase
LIFQSGNYPYRITNTWGDGQDTFWFFTQDNFNHLLYTDKQPLTIVVSKPSNSIVQGVALFSFIFTFCTVILILILFVYIGINAHFFRQYKLFNNAIITKVRNVFNRFMLIDNPDILYIRTRIQTSIIFIVFITLAFTSYFTISFITQKYNNRQTERLMKKLRNVVITIENENITEMNEGTTGELEAFINQIADVYDTDITLYAADGKVMASSIGKIYDEGIVAGLMNPNAFFHLNFLKESQFSQDEYIASLDFQAAYAPVFKNKQEVLGYLQLPYFSQKADLLAEISSVIVGFINLYVLLFIIIGIIAYLVSRNISYPLTLIQQKLSHTVLGSKNEPISWQRDDEIGELVKQYNSMIAQLEESAKKLAETEREGAWREIARQIAHEIKNPLTPMKLSIQHLHRAFKNNDANLEDKIERTTNLLVNQIDSLSELATEFSSFAKMPTPNYEHLNVGNVLSQVVELYSANTETEIVLTCNENIEIEFDRSYLSRSVGNIVKNALQAIPEGKNGRVDISVIDGNENIIIIVNDNGSGINPDQAEKIFMPYFSTKISGMGLGLPIVKNMIESGGGHISFKTVVDIGTEFTITLPKNST